MQVIKTFSYAALLFFSCAMLGMEPDTLTVIFAPIAGSTGDCPRKIIGVKLFICENSLVLNEFLNKKYNKTVFLLTDDNVNLNIFRLGGKVREELREANKELKYIGFISNTYQGCFIKGIKYFNPIQFSAEIMAKSQQALVSKEHFLVAVGKTENGLVNIIKFTNESVVAIVPGLTKMPEVIEQVSNNSEKINTSQQNTPTHNTFSSRSYWMFASLVGTAAILVYCFSDVKKS